jgi:RHS repeat-associated protein
VGAPIDPASVDESSLTVTRSGNEVPGTLALVDAATDPAWDGRVLLWTPDDPAAYLGARYDVALDLALLDVAGRPVDGPTTLDYDHIGQGDIVWSKPAEAPLLGGSQVGNDRFLHGRPYIRTLGLYDHRARFYEPGTQLFLEPDPLGPVDSPNLYQAFGFDAGNVVDPYGRNVVDPDLILNPQYRHFEFEGQIYGVHATTLAVGLQTPDGYRSLDPGDSAEAETIAVIHSMYKGGVSLPANYQMLKVLQGVNRRLTDEERRQTTSDLAGVTPVAGDIQDFYIVWSGRNPITGEYLGPWEYGLTVVAAALPVVSGHTVARIAGKGVDKAVEAGASLGRRDVPRFRIYDESGKPWIEIDPRGTGSIYRDPATGRWRAPPAELQGMPSESTWVMERPTLEEMAERTEEAIYYEGVYEGLRRATDPTNSPEEVLGIVVSEVAKQRRGK